MRILTLMGTRPEIIRLSRIIPKVDEISEHTLVYTGQNTSTRLSGVFFEELRVREPNRTFSLSQSSPFSQVASLFVETEKTIREVQPDKILILGDTNSALSAFVAKRMGVPVFHMEAGNRCYDERVPEEVNRRVIDSCSHIHLPYTETSRQNLIREGFDPKRIIVVGNPIREVMQFYSKEIDSSDIVKSLELYPGDYLLATSHRQENVDDPGRLRQVLESLQAVSEETGKRLIFSTHPRTQASMEKWKLGKYPNLEMAPAFGYFDFMALQRSAALVITDSGTVQEEACLLGIPAVTIREATERPETVVCGSNKVVGITRKAVVEACLESLRNDQPWNPPKEYLEGEVSTRVANLLTEIQN